MTRPLRIVQPGISPQSIKRKIPVPLWEECKNTEQPYGGKDSMENKTFDKAALMLNEPEKIRVYRFGNTVYKVGNFFSKKNTETMKEILERTIRREAKSQVKN